MADKAKVLDYNEIKDFKAMITDFHATRVAEQIIDQAYYDDTFSVRIKAPFHVVRTHNGARIVDNIVAHLRGASLQVFREPKSASEKSRESATKVARMLNVWAKNLAQEIDDALFNGVQRGEFAFQIEFNNEAYDNETFLHRPDQMPVNIISVDPLNIFCYPYDSLYPSQVVKSFYIDYSLASTIFPEIPAPEKGKDSVEYWAYWDHGTRYFEINGKDVTKGDKNIFGFCPFVHGYAGFGKRSASGYPELLAVGKLRKLRHTLVEDCEVSSRIDSILALYANPLFVVAQDKLDADMTGKDELEKTVLGAGMTVTIPYGWKAEIYTPEVATAQLFHYYDQIQDRLGLDSPSIMSGLPNNSRTTGIQEDIEFGHIYKKYEKLIYNMERTLEAAFGRALQLLYNVPKALPLTFRATELDKGQTISKDEEITKEDIDAYFECKIAMNPESGVEDDRDFMKYRMLVNEGRIGWEEFLVKGCKKTEWEAKNTIAEALAEQAVRDDPLMKAARTQEALEQMGMTRYVQQANQDAKMDQRMQMELQNYSQAGGAGYRPPEVDNPMAGQQARQLLSGQSSAKGIRPSPQMNPAQGSGQSGQ